MHCSYCNTVYFASQCFYYLGSRCAGVGIPVNAFEVGIYSFKLDLCVAKLHAVFHLCTQPAFLIYVKQRVVFNFKILVNFLLGQNNFFSIWSCNLLLHAFWVMGHCDLHVLFFLFSFFFFVFFVFFFFFFFFLRIKLGIY